MQLLTRFLMITGYTTYTSTVFCLILVAQWLLKIRAPPSHTCFNGSEHKDTKTQKLKIEKRRSCIKYVPSSYLYISAICGVKVTVSGPLHPA